MIINLFSVFDPVSRAGAGLNWVAITLGLLILPMVKWIIRSRIVVFIDIIFKGLNKEIRPVLKIKKGVSLVIFSALFFFILLNNLIGLLPFIFTSTRHLAITLRLALPLWLGYYSYGWVNNFKYILAHLIPQGTPRLLMPFIVLIERVRRLIRPITLAVRLIANIIAGHLLLTLIRRAISVFRFTRVIIIVRSQILLIVLEMAVAVIQSYVLVVLRVLYYREV